MISPPLPLSGNLSEFLDETPQKVEGWGENYGENFVILTSTVFD